MKLSEITIRYKYVHILWVYYNVVSNITNISGFEKCIIYMVNILYST